MLRKSDFEEIADENDAEERLGLFAGGERVLGAKWMAWKQAPMEYKTLFYTVIQKNP